MGYYDDFQSISEKANQEIREVAEEDYSFYEGNPAARLRMINAIIADAERNCMDNDEELELDFDVRLIIKGLENEAKKIEMRREEERDRWRDLTKETGECLGAGILPPVRNTILDLEDSCTDYDFEELEKSISDNLRSNGYPYVQLDAVFQSQIIRVTAAAPIENTGDAFLGSLIVKFDVNSWYDLTSIVAVKRLVSAWCHKHPTANDIENSPLCDLSDIQEESAPTQDAIDRNLSISRCVFGDATYDLARFCFLSTKKPIDTLRSWSPLLPEAGTAFKEHEEALPKMPSNFYQTLLSFEREAGCQAEEGFANRWVESVNGEISWLLDGDSYEPVDFEQPDISHGLSISGIGMSCEFKFKIRDFGESVVGFDQKHNVLGAVAYMAKQYTSEKSSIEVRFFLKPASRATAEWDFSRAFTSCIAAICYRPSKYSTLDENCQRELQKITTVEERREAGDDTIIDVSRGIVRISDERYIFSYTCIQYLEDSYAPPLFSKLEENAEAHKQRMIADPDGYNTDSFGTVPPCSFPELFEQYASEEPYQEPLMGSVSLDGMSGVEFEKVCQTLVAKMGFATETTKASGDGGIDIIAHNNAPLLSGKYVIQCKRYSGNVGEPIIRDLYGVVMSERANKGILMTTGGFTRQALSFSEDKQIELIDGNALRSLLEQYGLDETRQSGEDEGCSYVDLSSDEDIKMVLEQANSIRSIIVDINNVNDDGDPLFGLDDDQLMRLFDLQLSQFMMWVLEAGIEVTETEAKLVNMLTNIGLNHEELEAAMGDPDVLPFDFAWNPPSVFKAFCESVSALGIDANPYESVCLLFNNVGYVLANLDNVFGGKKINRVNEYVEMIRES